MALEPFNLDIFEKLQGLWMARAIQLTAVIVLESIFKADLTDERKRHALRGLKNQRRLIVGPTAYEDWTKVQWNFTQFRS